MINGQKMWTSLAGASDYLWLAVRTDQEAKKHKGISVIIVPLDTPGITLQRLTLMASHDINATFLDDVRVPAKYLVGEENGGWGLITQPAQPRTGHAVLQRQPRADARGRP